MERKKTPTWVWVVLGVVGFCVLAFVVLVGGGIYMFRQHVQTEEASTQDVQKEFEQARQRFAGQQPLVEVRTSDNDDRQVVVHKPLETAERRPISNRSACSRTTRVRVESYVSTYRSGSRGWRCPSVEARGAAESP